MTTKKARATAKAKERAKAKAKTKAKSKMRGFFPFGYAQGQNDDVHLSASPPNYDIPFRLITARSFPLMDLSLVFALDEVFGEGF